MVGQQARALEIQVRSLEQLAELTRRLDERLAPQVTAASDALYAVRQRRRDVLMNLAVAQQGLTSLRQIERNNNEVIRALRSASTTTLTALRTAGLALRALDDTVSAAVAWHDSSARWTRSTASAASHFGESNALAGRPAHTSRDHRSLAGGSP